MWVGPPLLDLQVVNVKKKPSVRSRLHCAPRSCLLVRLHYSVYVCRTSAGLSTWHTTTPGISMKENYGNTFQTSIFLALIHYSEVQNSASPNNHHWNQWGKSKISTAHIFFEGTQHWNYTKEKHWYCFFSLKESSRWRCRSLIDLLFCTWNLRMSRGLPAFFKQFWLHLRKNFRKNL